MPIRETPNTGITYDRAMAALWAKVFELRCLVDSLYSYFNGTNVTDINSYRVRQIKRLSLMADTFVGISFRRKDLVSAHILQRCIVDSATGFLIIYDNDNSESILLRHYLYLLDGNKAHNDAVGAVDMELYPKTIREDVSRLAELNKKEYERSESLFVEKIKELSIYKADSSRIDKLIKSRNWKYQDIDKPAENVKWKTLYGKIDKLAPADLTSYLSQDIHGLSFSVENIDAAPENFTGSIIQVVYICERIMNYMERRMGNLWLPQIQEYYERLISSDAKPSTLE